LEERNTMRPTESHSTAPARPLRRLAWLVACILAGGIVAFIGNAFMAHQAWALAIPAAVAAGWLFVADPTKCDPPSRR
jgi:hypothetical protein